MMKCQNKNKEKLQAFWALNIINLITTGGILAYLFIYFCNTFPVEAYNIGVLTIIQSVVSYVLNYIVYKNAK